MAINRFYVSPSFETQQTFAHPDALLDMQLRSMIEQASDTGCSTAHDIPVNGALRQAYKEFGETPTPDQLIDYNPLQALPEALMAVTGVARATTYSRMFKPGEGEGTHDDDHDWVLTYTQAGDALFTIDASPPFNSHKLGANKMILFNSRRKHEVSAPTTRGSRTISAFAVDL